MDDFEILDKMIHTMENPIIYMNHVLTDLKSYDDSMLCLIFKLIIKYHFDVMNKIDISCFKNQLINYPITFDIINTYYQLIYIQLNILPFLQKWKTIYINSRFWKQSIQNQIISLRKLRTTFLAIFDGSKGTMLFHINLLMTQYNTYHVDEMISRLTMVFKLFKYTFFDKIGCNVITLDSFIYMSYDEQKKYISTIFIKVIKTLNTYISYFELYDINRIKLENLSNPTILIEIDTDDVDSDIELNDLPFIFEH